MDDEQVIYRSAGGGTDTTIRVSRNANGDLEISGQDVGAAPREFLGDSDHEYWITIPAGHAEGITPELLRTLAQRPPGGTAPIIAWLRERSIPHSFRSY
jgi:hypothetical protein